MRLYVLRGRFPRMGEIDKDLHLYKIMNFDIRFIPE